MDLTKSPPTLQNTRSRLTARLAEAGSCDGSPVLVQMWAGVSPVLVLMCEGGRFDGLETARPRAHDSVLPACTSPCTALESTVSQVRRRRLHSLLSTRPAHMVLVVLRRSEGFVSCRAYSGRARPETTPLAVGAIAKTGPSCAVSTCS